MTKVHKVNDSKCKNTVYGEDILCPLKGFSNILTQVR